MKKQIRNVKLSDAAQIADIYGYYVKNTAISFELSPPSEEEMRHRIEKYTKVYPWIVLEIDGEIIGYAYAGQFRERAAFRFTTEISVYLSLSNLMKGYGRALAVELLKELTRRGFYVAIAGITASNQISIEFFESLGFEECAKFNNVGYKNGEWHSVVMLSKNLQEEFPAIPQETSKEFKS